MQVRAERLEEGLVQRNLAPLDALPGSIGRGAGDGEVDPVLRDPVLGFVVGYRAEGRDYLSAISGRSRLEWGKACKLCTYADAAYIEEDGFGRSHAVYASKSESTLGHCY